MPGVDAIDFSNRSATLPYLHLFRRNIDCEGTLSAYFQISGTIPALPHLCNKRKLFPGAVKLGITKFLQGMGVERNVFSHPAIFNNKVKALAINLFCKQAVDGTSAFEPRFV